LKTEEPVVRGSYLCSIQMFYDIVALAVSTHLV
jgi:hypothetical protein